MSYIPGSNPDSTIDAELTDIQAQITANLNAQNAGLNGLKTQIKQVTLSLEGTLKTVKAAFDALKAYVMSKLPS